MMGEHQRTYDLASRDDDSYCRPRRVFDLLRLRALARAPRIDCGGVVHADVEPWHPRAAFNSG